MKKLLVAHLRWGLWRTIVVIVCFFAGAGCRLGPDTPEGVTTIQIDLEASLSSLSWSPDGGSIAAIADEGFNQRSVIVIDVDTGEYHVIAEYDDRNLSEARGPSWSPDGQALILFYPVARDVAAVHLPHPDIVIVNAHTGELLRRVGDGNYAAWGKQQNQAVIIDSDAGRSGTEVPIRLLDLETGQVQVLGLARPDLASVYEVLDVSSTGHLVYPTNDSRPIIALATGEQVGQVEAAFPRSPKWSPNGQMLAYIEANPGNDIWVRLATSDGSCLSMPIEITAVSLDWSPDGTRLVYSSGADKQEQGKLHILDLTAGIGKELMDSFQTCPQ